MHHRVYLVFPVLALSILAALFSIEPLAHAESILWNTAETVNLCNAQGAGYACASRLINPNITIQYHAQVTDDAGVPISCGATVPAGTTLHLSFVPHTYEDVYWFGTGFSFDSPYGEWRADAAPPAVSYEEKDYTGTIYTGSNGAGSEPLASYRPLVVNPPVKTISDANGLGCLPAGSDGSQICTPQQGGTFTPQFNFGDTFGKFYWRFKNLNNGIGVGDNIPMITFTTTGDPSYIPYYGPNGYDYHGEGITLGPTYTLTVPTQQISCPITVVAGSGNPPTAPKLSTAGACIIGTPYSISMQSTDPDSDQIRYGIDWDANGLIDQYVPGSGYVQSGTTQTASRTYSMAGAKTVKVLAQDANGFSSSWVTLSFNCADSSTAGLNENENSNTNDNNNFNGGPAAVDLTLRVVPSLVRSGNTTKVNWSATGVSSCTVSAPNGDAWDTILSVLGGNISKPITGQTTYTLSCIDAGGETLTKTATVNIIPTFQEL